METEEAAETAIKELNGREVKGRPMKVGSVFNFHFSVFNVLCSVFSVIGQMVSLHSSVFSVIGQMVSLQSSAFGVDHFVQS